MKKDVEWLKEKVEEMYTHYSISNNFDFVSKREAITEISNLIDQLDEPPVMKSLTKEEHIKSHVFEPDIVNRPTHYQGIDGLEVEDVLRNFIPRYTDPYVGHRIASAIEYLLRSPLKNGQQDIKKARKNLDQALGYMEEKEE